MTEVVLDASALLALIFREPGHEQVEQWLSGSVISAANLSEVATRLVRRGADDQEIRDILAGVGVPPVPVDQDIALQAAAMHRETAAQGLSLGDRLCLATAQARGVPAVTADRAWQGLQVAVEVVCIR